MKDDTLKIISVVNFVRGGKSSISRLLAEKLKTTILNFDPNRNSEFYNAVKTVNIEANSTVTKKKNILSIETQEDIFEISSKSNFLLCDFGGRFDERINEFKSDVYILPMMDDFESIRETMRATSFVLSNNPDAKIIHVLNMAQAHSKKEKEDFREGYKNNLEAKGLFGRVESLEMPRSQLLKELVNKGIHSYEIKTKNHNIKNYPNINKFLNELIKLIKEEIGI